MSHARFCSHVLVINAAGNYHASITVLGVERKTLIFVIYNLNPVQGLKCPARCEFRPMIAVVQVSRPQAFTVQARTAAWHPGSHRHDGGNSCHLVAPPSRDCPAFALMQLSCSPDYLRQAHPVPELFLFFPPPWWTAGPNVAVVKSSAAVADGVLIIRLTSYVQKILRSIVLPLRGCRLPC